MQIWAESGKSALPICNYSQILYQFLTFTQNLKRSQFPFSAVLLPVVYKGKGHALPIKFAVLSKRHSLHTYNDDRVIGCVGKFKFRISIRINLSGTDKFQFTGLFIVVEQVRIQSCIL